MPQAREDACDRVPIAVQTGEGGVLLFSRNAENKSINE